MKIRKTTGNRAFDIINTALLLLLTIIMIYPLYYVLVASFSTYNSILKGNGILLFPSEFTVEAYKLAFKNPMIIKGFGNTLFVVIVGVLVNLIITSIGAYFLSRKNVFWQKPIMILIIITMYFSGGMIPFYFAVKDLGLENSLFALIVPTAINTFNLIIMKVSFSDIPSSIEEAVKIDGGGHFIMLFKIILPLSKATLAVIGLYYAVSHWNAWFNAMLFLKDRSKYPIQLILREILIQNNMNNMMSDVGAQEANYIGETVKYAVIIISTVPILVVYPFLQKYFTNGVMIGAVKG
ncbi:MAG: carbohydrate ABC transporter permease [Clostridia bacterium]|nr:carbohydrate ABC transporter permease [Clostridia bacterium]